MRADLVLLDEGDGDPPDGWPAAFERVAGAAARLGDAFAVMHAALDAITPNPVPSGPVVYHEREPLTGHLSTGKAFGKTARHGRLQGHLFRAPPAVPMPTSIRWSPEAREVVEPGEKARLLERIADDDARNRLHRSVNDELVRRFQAWAARVEATGRDTPPTP